MAVTPIGLNYTSISDYNLTLDLPTNAGDWIPAIIQNANTSTNHLFTFIIMGTWFLILYWALSDKSPFGSFKFSDPRGLNTAFGCVSVLGISFIEAGFFTSFRTVALFIVLFIVSFIFTLNYEQKE